MSNELIPFDVASFLDSDEAISEYLTQVLSDGDCDEFVRAVGYVAKARGMSHIAEASGLGRASLYKALAPGAKPRFDTVVRVMHALGVELHAKVAGAVTAASRV
ncbi:addiction module antidote protein [Pseudomonas sp. SLFW]|uniref:addiction module antidote protein n=1 Tax=Pseudomonas sp. SLFW TaxID=2683259 RepID=UPI0014120289|nr:addiction module antidote protein [Pseudomonas sp. SLFW]NBB08495.1 putative addiction module antidote protein [Pseudomonas sp. SLFW]